MAKTENIPASLAVAKAGVTYNVSPAAKAALNVFVADVAEDRSGQLRAAGLPLQSRAVQPDRDSAWARQSPAR